MDENEQFKALIAGKTEYRDVNVRGVDGGYVVSAQRRWIDKTVGQVVAQLPLETIAATNEDAAQKVSAFFLTGSFDVVLDS